MKASEDGSIILIENPFCGNTSTAAALGLAPVAGVPKWATPAQGRAVVTGAQWRAARKIILVRNTLARFESAATYALTKPEGFPEDFKAVLVALGKGDTTAYSRARAILQWLLVNAERPVAFKQQAGWLAGRYDLVLATHDIAAYMNSTRDKAALRAPLFANNPAFIKARVAAVDMPLLEQAYAADVALFKQLRVWSPRPEDIRLINGTCAVCMRREAERKGSSATVDLTVEEVLPTAPPLVPAAEEDEQN